MKLRINGEEREVAGVRTVSNLIEVLALPAAALLVEHSGIALRRDEWDHRLLGEDDQIEFIRIVAGG